MARKAKAGTKTKQENAKTAAQAGSEAALPITINKNALSTEVGPAVIANWSKSLVEENKLKSAVQTLAVKRYDILSQLTQGMVKAAQNDDSIDINAVFTPGTGKTRLLNQMGIALGYYVTEEVKGKIRIKNAPSVAKFFPSGRDNKESAEYRRKKTFRENFSHQVTKCLQAAAGIVSNDIQSEIDESGTLLLTGPAIEKQFGAPSVLLNEKQTVRTEEGETKLNEKPSFTSIVRMGAANAGAEVKVRKDSRSQVVNDTSDSAFVSICDSFITAANKLYNGEGLSEKQLSAVRSVQSTCAEVLGVGNNQAAA